MNGSDRDPGYGRDVGGNPVGALLIIAIVAVLAFGALGWLFLPA